MPRCEFCGEPEHYPPCRPARGAEWALYALGVLVVAAVVLCTLGKFWWHL